MRNRFERQLETLKTQLIAMGALCEETIAHAAAALCDGSRQDIADSLAADTEIDRKEREIENLCLKLLLQQQPVAGDLRKISSALKMVTDMERIGDQAADIVEIVRLNNIKTSDDHMHIGNMAAATSKMVTDSIDAFVKDDLALAEEVIAYDDVVDDLFNRVKGEIIDLIGQDPDKGEYAVDLLMIAKYFERIGDHAVNIAEWVAFSITGIHKGED